MDQIDEWVLTFGSKAAGTTICFEKEIIHQIVQSEKGKDADAFIL